MHSEGILKSQGEAKTIQNWMDGKITGGLASDPGAAELYKADGSYTDTDVKARYTQGFQDIH